MTILFELQWNIKPMKSPLGLSQEFQNNHKCWIGPQKRNKQTKGQRRICDALLELAWTESAIYRNVITQWTFWPLGDTMWSQTQGAVRSYSTDMKHIKKPSVILQSDTIITVNRLQLSYDNTKKHLGPARRIWNKLLSPLRTNLTSSIFYEKIYKANI